jgi:hypothetical protein
MTRSGTVEWRRDPAVLVGTDDDQICRSLRRHPGAGVHRVRLHGVRPEGTADSETGKQRCSQLYTYASRLGSSHSAGCVIFGAPRAPLDPEAMNSDIGNRDVNVS